ncbi:hypothetical protein BS47DRAFT_703076 [Hydnum rufescens UP504]|uniref:Uncharacterized protein n=1 Tax=Hydnum rufescens UP504 TaxID=1448309 RepID=A0A9P6B1W2_9AGAM|nr:hypothetical protein BS47DRAFT_703076 [Hydnum rufescens UP504]
MIYCQSKEQEKKKNAQKKKRNPQSRAPTQGAPSSPCDSPPEIATGAEAERCSEFPSPRAPLPHNDSPGGSTSTSDAVEVFKGLMQEQAASFQMQIKDLQTQMEGLGTQLKKENALLKEENASLKKETARLKHDLTQLRNDNNVLKKDNAQLKQDNARLKQDNARLKQDTEPELARLTKETDALKAENKLLKHNIGLMKEQLRIHTLILHPLHRRAILDNARDNIIADYPRDDWSILFPAPVTTQTPTIVDKIHGVLKVEDRMILTKKAVEAIVVNGSGTIRGVGNVAAHRASDTQQSNAALASDLSEPEEDNEVCFPICSWV